jgi:hypothetical protein
MEQRQQTGYGNFPSVVLTPSELARAYRVGVARHDEHERAGRFDPRLYSAYADAGERIHITGAASELAVAKFFGMPWSGEFFRLQDWQQYRYAGHDVGELEVRTNMRWHGVLRVYPRDTNASPYILVRSDTSPIYYLTGWVFAREAKRRERYVSDSPRPFYKVTLAELYPIAALLKLLRGGQPAWK